MNARVVGAGLSGLAGAWCLRDAGFSVEVVEGADGPGGLIGTARTAEGLVERAANAFVWNETVARWFARLGITPVLAEPASRRRYVFRDHQPRRWPLTPVETAQLAARVATAAVTRQLRPRRNETVATFATRVAGPAATRWLVGPALQGIYAAPPDRLSAEAIFGKRSRGRLRLAAPPGGMGDFTDRLHQRLVDRGVSFHFGQILDELDPSVPTLICTNAPSAARLLAGYAPDISRAIAGVRMTDVVTTTAFYEKSPNDVEGFGVLFPRGLGVSALGVLFNATVFEARSAHRLETWIYGAPHGSNELPTADDIAATVGADRRILTRRDHHPLAQYTTRRSPALPIYDANVLAVSRQLDSLPPWVALAGNYLGQIGVSRLLGVAESAAARLTGLTSRRSSPS